MQAIVYERYGTAEMLRLQEIAKPAPKDNEVLVKVLAVGLNSADWRFLRADPFFIRFMNGVTRPHKVNILGADIAGVVEATGTQVTRFQPGDAVFGELDDFGGLAEYVCVPETSLVAKPEALSFEEAATLPMAGSTALQGLRDHGQVRPGQKVLIVGASGGVGTFAVQIARALGAEVTAVCSTAKVEQARALGADHVIDYNREDFTRNGQMYDVILAANGDRSLGDYERALAPGGTVVVAGGTMSQIFQTILFGSLKSKRSGKTFKNFTANTSLEDLAVLVEMIAAGRLKPVIDRCYPLRETPDAMRYLGEGHARGKIVISVI